MTYDHINRTVQINEGARTLASFGYVTANRVRQ
jgi:hypothetical protein